MRMSRAGATLLAGFALAGGVMVTASPASAADGWTKAPSAATEVAPTAGAAACVQWLDKPDVSNRRVNAGSRTLGCQSWQSFGAALQRHRAWGWQHITDQTWKGNEYRGLSAGCAANDLYTYRVAAFGTFGHSSSEHRERC